MTTVARGSQSLPVLNSALAWINSSGIGDPLHELAPLRHHLRGIAGTAMDPVERLKTLPLFQRRADAINDSLKTLLHQSTLPLMHRLRLIAQGLTEIHGLLAATTLHAARNLTASKLAEAGRCLGNLCIDIFRNLAEQQQVALLVASTPHADLWRNSQIAYSLLAQCSPEEVAASGSLFKDMLALAAVQPETFAGHEIGLLIDYLRRSSHGVTIDRQPQGPLDSWYWLDERRGLPPMAVARRPPPAGGKTLYFNCSALAQTTEEHLRWLAAGENPEALGQPPLTGKEDCRGVLSRALAQWSSPPRRRNHHRPSSYSVEICPEFDRLWDLLSGTGDEGIEQVPIPITKWMVLNESPGGFAMMHLSGTFSGLVSGGALGLRTSPERPWNICLVRWARSNNPEHIEVGLELIAPSAAPVQIVRRDDETGSRLTRALLLRPAPGRRESETLLTSRSDAVGRPFTLIAEPDGKLQLTECKVQRLALQTSNMEMLEFERNFSPCR
jgi:hypothetical protein